MLSFAGSLKIYVAIEPCDMRKSFNGLYALAEGKLQEDPRNGAIFVFTRRRRGRTDAEVGEQSGGEYG